MRHLEGFGTSLRCLFKAVASHTSLKKVILTRFRDEDVAEICKALRDTRVQERCFVGVHLVSQNTVEALTVCKELSSIIVDSRKFRNFDTLLTTVRLLPSCSHVTSVCLLLRQELFNGLCFDETETQILADTLLTSRTLCEVSFFPDNHESTVLLIQKLSPNVSSNYTLLQLRLSRYVQIGDDWFTVADVVSRNISLVMRAAHFVTGTKHRYCAAAADLVHTNPGLVEKVQELASVNESEAVSRINRSLQNISELNEFMRVAGVVKNSVTCHRRDDGKKQLTDLNRDCWLHLRQFLKFRDIRGEQ
ncbi:hypothetical protein MTO96_050974 [Rhipicephalus appendiculatus]